MDLRDFVISSVPVVDTSRITGVADAVARLSLTDPSASVRSALTVGSVAQALLTPSASLLGHHALSSRYAESALSSLASLRTPFATLSVGPALSPFAATVSALSSAVDIGTTFRDLAARSIVFDPPLRMNSAHLGSAAHAIGVADSLASVSRLTGPYFASPLGRRSRSSR